MKKIVLVLCCFAVASTAVAMPPVPKGGKGGLGLGKALEHASPVIKAAPKITLTPAAIRRAYEKVIVAKGGPSQLLKETIAHYHNFPETFPTTINGAKEFRFHENGTDFTNLVRNLSTLGYFYPEQSVQLASLVATKFNETTAQAVTDIIFARIVMKANTPEAWSLLSKYTNEHEVSGAFWQYIKDVAWEEHRITLRVANKKPDEVGYPKDKQVYEIVSNRGPLALSAFDPSAETTMALLDNSLLEEIGQLETPGPGLFLGNAYVPMLTKTKLEEVAVPQTAFVNRYLKGKYRAGGKDIYTYYLNFQKNMRNLFQQAEEDIRAGKLDERAIDTYTVKAISYSLELRSFRHTYLDETPETLQNFAEVLEDLLARLELERVLVQ